MIAEVLSLTRWEWYKLRHRRMPWILLGVAVLLVQIAFWASDALFRSGEMTVGEGGASGTTTISTTNQFLEMFAFPTSLTNGLIVAHGFGGILLMILAASLIGTEYGWGTLRTALTKGTGRWPLLTAKLLLLAGLSVAVLIVAAASVAVSSAIALATLDADWLSSSADWSDLGIGFGKAVFGMLPYIALAVFAAVLTSSSGAAIGISLGYYFVESILVGVLAGFDWFQRVAGFILGRAVSGWVQTEGVSFQPLGTRTNAGLPDASQAFLVLLAYVVVLTGAALWVFQRREVAGAKGE